MKPKKSSKIIILVIIILLILVIGIGIAYAYLSTDLLKSNKQLFFNYLTQIGNTQEETGFIEADLAKYFEKKKNTPYTNKGNFYVNITAPEEYMPTIQPTNKMDITFDGETDASAEKRVQNISINYSDDVKLEFIYKQIESIYGLQNNYVGKKYIAIDTAKSTDESSTKEIEESIEKIENISNPQISQEEAKQILDKYLDILDQELQDSNFSKVQENNQTGYKLALSGEQLKNILTKIFETAKNDQELLEKINQQTSEEYTVDDIQDIIDELDDNIEAEQKIEITVYQNARKTNKITIVVDTLKIEISKANEAGELQYNLSLEEQEDEQTAFKAYLKLKFAGLATMQNISEKYELGIEFPIEEENSSYTYYFNNDITFSETSNIEEFTESNCLDLSSLEEEQANDLTTAIVERIQLVNKKQMEELGLDENTNPLINMLPTLLLYEMGTSSLTDATDQMSQTEISTYNSQYELYQGTNLKGTTVKGLLTTISKNNGLDDESEENGTNSGETENSNNKRLIEEINFNGEEYEVNLQNLTIIRGEIGTEDYYRVEFEKNEDGAIYRAVINKK